MFKIFSEALTTIAASWDPDDHHLPESAGSFHTKTLHHPYINASEAALAEIQYRTDDLRVTELSRKPGVRHGVNVIFRYYAHAVASAAIHGVEYDQAVSYLRADEGMSILDRLASDENDVATNGEGWLCIGQDSYSTLEGQLSDIYSWKDGTLSHPGLETRLINKKLELVEWGKSEKTQCHARKAHQLTSISHAILDICERDPRLAENTYVQFSRLPEDARADFTLV